MSARERVMGAFADVAGTASGAGDHQTAASNAALNVTGLLGAMDVLFMEFPLTGNAEADRTIERLRAVHQAAEVFAKQVEEFFHGA